MAKYTKENEFTLKIEEPKMVEKPSDTEIKTRTYD